MPTYYAAGVSVRLSTTSIHDSLSHTTLKGVGGNVKIEKQRAQAAVTQGDGLKEGFPDASDIHLDFLGRWNPVPFYCAGVSVASLEPAESTSTSKSDSRSSSRTRRNQNPSTSSINLPPPPLAPLPKALVLCVELDKVKTFCRDRDGNYKSDIKIEVFFNGQFTNTTCIPRHANHEKDKKKVYFSGMRIDRLVEAAWLLYHPHGKAGLQPESFLESENENDEHAKRWSQVSAAIKQEANGRGFDEKGRRSPSGEYLQSLSSLKMPKAIKSLKNQRGLQFGIIDVVITLGEGKKYGTKEGYLRQPHRLLDARFLAPTPGQISSCISDNGSVGESQSLLAVHGPNTRHSEAKSIAPSVSLLVLTSTPESASASSKLRPSPLNMPKGHLQKRSTLGFLDTVRKSDPQPVRDMESYGIGPPAPPVMPPPQLPVKKTFSTNRKPTLEQPSKTLESRTFDPSGLSPSFKVLSTFSPTPGRSLDPPRLSPSPKILSKFSIPISRDPPSVGNVNPDDVKTEQAASQCKSPPSKRHKVELDTPPRTPSYSPITPTAISCQDSVVAANYFHLPDDDIDAPQASVASPASSQATIPLSEQIGNLEFDASGAYTSPAQPKLLHPLFEADLTDLEDLKQRAHQLFQDQARKSARAIQNRPLRGAVLKNRSIKYSAIQRLARQPSRESSLSGLGPPRIFLAEIQPPLPNGNHTSVANISQKTIQVGNPSNTLGPNLRVKLRMPAPGRGTITSGNEMSNTNVMTSTLSNQSIGSTGYSSPRKVVLTTKSLAVAKKDAQTSTSKPSPKEPECPARPSRKSATTSTPSQDTPFSNLKPALAPSTAAIDPDAKAQLAKLQKSSDTKSSGSPYMPPVFEIPELSRDCIISYSSRPNSPKAYLSAGSPTINNGKASGRAKTKLDPGRRGGENKLGDRGAYRQVPSERTGEFTEAEVLLGVRFVIGGA